MSTQEIDLAPSTTKGAPRYEMVRPEPTQTAAIQRYVPQRIQRVEDYNMDVAPTSIQTVIVKTSAVDRAQGFLIASVPRTFAFALTTTILSIVVGGVTLVTSFVILFSVFTIAELFSYAVTLLMSAEGVSWYEARRKWNVIDREQKNRWQHYGGK